MRHISIEIKAKCENPEKIRRILKSHNAEFIGKDHQTDTYLRVHYGRLKIRKGNIEKFLIYYNRADTEHPKKSDVTLLELEEESQLEAILRMSLNILNVVEKEREIYFIENVKFHLDNVKGLGSFVEIEAIDKDGIGEEKLREQCEEYMRLFEIREGDLIKDSYCDLLLKKY